MGTAAAAQNVIPLPIADLVVLFGAFLAARFEFGWAGVFLAAWIGNAGTAAILYGLARRYRDRRPESRVVRWLLKGRSSRDGERVSDWHPFHVFVASFLPVRPLLPVLAGLGGVSFWRLILPLATAAGAWYAGLVLVGATGGRNFPSVLRAFAAYSREFLYVTVGLVAVTVVWWWFRRRRTR